MFTFTDVNGIGVELSFKKEAFPIKPMHVLVIPRYEGKYVLTVHPKRGLEFPGGKVEQNETLEQAALRELFEETGATAKELDWLAIYLVQEEQPFTKAVFIADVQLIETNHTFLETVGYQLVEDAQLFMQPNLSFYMRDLGMKKMIEKVNERES